jgi:hypothetical protein
MTSESLIAANVAAMGIEDWAALLLATCVAALAVMGELKVRRVLSLASTMRLDLSGSGSYIFLEPDKSKRIVFP